MLDLLSWVFNWNRAQPATQVGVGIARTCVYIEDNLNDRLCRDRNVDKNLTQPAPRASVEIACI